MTVMQAAVLGLLQGLAEFLPVSSSAHLVIAPWLFGWPDPGLAFDVSLHLGTLFAVLWYFRAEWIALIRAVGRVIATRKMSNEEERRAVFLVIATIPGGIAGLLFEKKADTAFRDPRLIAVALIVMGIALWLVDRMARADRPLKDVTLKDSLLIGLAQMFAIIPGVSRSGSTITAGRALGLTREGAATFSFLMSMPIIAAAAILKVPHVVREGGFNTPAIVGILISAISGWAAIAALMKFVIRRSYGVFAIYRVVLGVAVIAIAMMRG